MASSAARPNDKLVSDLKEVVADAEELLKLTAGHADEKLGKLRDRLGDRLAATKVRIADAEAAVIAKTKEVAHSTDEYVHDHPWKAVGVAAGVAFLLGLLAGRR